MFGTSTPTAVLPGIGARTRTSVAASAYLRSSLRLATLPTLIPGSSCSSYRVTRGPETVPMTCAGMLKLARVVTRRSETRATASDDSPSSCARRLRTAGSGNVQWRFSASANASATSASTGRSPPPATAAASESCTPSSPAATGSGPSGDGAGSPKISGAADAPSISCDTVGTGRAKSSSVGGTVVRMRSEASRVGDSSGPGTWVSMVSRRRAPNASAWSRAARRALATPARERAAH